MNAWTVNPYAVQTLSIAAFALCRTAVVAVGQANTVTGLLVQGALLVGVLAWTVRVTRDLEVAWLPGELRAVATAALVVTVCLLVTLNAALVGSALAALPGWPPGAAQLGGGLLLAVVGLLMLTPRPGLSSEPL